MSDLLVVFINASQSSTSTKTNDHLQLFLLRLLALANNNNKFGRRPICEQTHLISRRGQSRFVWLRFVSFRFVSSSIVGKLWILLSLNTHKLDDTCHREMEKEERGDYFSKKKSTRLKQEVCKVMEVGKQQLVSDTSCTSLCCFCDIADLLFAATWYRHHPAAATL